jgi:hypothetical protein
MITTSRLMALGSSAALASLSALHLAWGAGSSWPLEDRRALADKVAGTAEMPSAQACFAVAGALAGAAVVVAGGTPAPAARLARAAVAATLIGRGLTGLTGSTGRIVPWVPSDHFVQLDRRRYGPLCLGIGMAIAASMVKRSKPAGTPVSIGLT